MDQFDLELSQAQGQRNEIWHKERIGKFTASRFGDLEKRGRSYDSAQNKVIELQGRLNALNSGEIDKEINTLKTTLENPPKGTRKSTLTKRIDFLESLSTSETLEQLKEAEIYLESQKFGDVAMKYIYEKIAEISTGQFHEVSSVSMDWGTDHEQKAAELYEKETGNKVIPSGFISFNESAGGSPDGLVGSNGGIEIKCPWNSANHIKLMIEQEVTGNYLWQDQFNMMCTGRDWWDHVSYDPRFPEGMQLVIVRVERNEDLIEKIKLRLKEATEKLKELQNIYIK